MFVLFHHGNHDHDDDDDGAGGAVGGGLILGFCFCLAFHCYLDHVFLHSNNDAQ